MTTRYAQTILTTPREEWGKFPQFMLTAKGKKPKLIVIVGMENAHCQLHGDYIESAICYATIIPEGLSGLRSLLIKDIEKLEMVT